jgi:N-acetylneuraminic acid mutarotase
MIIWGATDGARYNPATDTWSPVNPQGAPDTRYAHSAIWTGTEMIVWGGVNGSIVLNTGARYSPVTNSWSPLSLVAAPTPRFDHFAVWTGHEMIVWGGSVNADGGTPLPLSSGARYSPTTDTWSPMTTTNAPALSSAAVWNGPSLLVPGATGTDNVHAYSPFPVVDFQITRIVRDHDSFSLEFPSLPGLTYTLWGSENLKDDSWIDTGLPSLSGNGGTLSFQVPLPTASSHAHFRVQSKTMAP